MRAAKPGAALLEVLIALAILASAGGSAMMMASQAARAVEHARAAEAEVRVADAFLTAVSLWTSEDLELRLGDRVQGSWRLRIDRPVPPLYVVVLRDSLDRVLLRTSLHRTVAR